MKLKIYTGYLNFDIPDKKSLKHISQPLEDQKSSISKFPLTAASFPTIDFMKIKNYIFCLIKNLNFYLYLNFD